MTRLDDARGILNELRQMAGPGIEPRVIVRRGAIDQRAFASFCSSTPVSNPVSRSTLMKSQLTPTVTVITSTVLLSTLAFAETSREELELKVWAYQEQAVLDYDPTAAPVRLLRILVFDSVARRKIWEVADQTVINPTDVLASASPLGSGYSTTESPEAPNPQSREERELKAWALENLKDDLSPGSGPRTLLCILWHHPPARQAIWQIAQETVIDDIPVVGSVRYKRPVEQPSSQPNESLQPERPSSQPDQSLQAQKPGTRGNRVVSISAAAGSGLLTLLALVFPWRRLLTRSEEFAR